MEFGLIGTKDRTLELLLAPIQFLAEQRGCRAHLIDAAKCGKAIVITGFRMVPLHERDLLNQLSYEHISSLVDSALDEAASGVPK